MKQRTCIRWAALAVAFCAVVSVAVIFSATPRNDRVWAPEFSKLNTIDTETDGTVVIHNVRDWTYSGTTVDKEAWVDEQVNLTNIVKTWFFLDRFSTNTLIAHTFLSFEFKDGSTLAFSIEARREDGEKYSLLGGFVPTFELQYLWGTERDFIPERATYGMQPLFMYPLTLSPAASQGLFKSLIEETDKLAATPRFYNSLTANCTNLLAKIVNEHYPHTLPYDFAWNLTGLSDRYLMRQGYIKTSGSTETLTEKNADITPYRADIEKLISSSLRDFSVELRKLIQSTEK